MKTFTQFVKKYPFFVAALSAGILGLVFFLVGLTSVTYWFLSIFCGLVAIKVAVDLVKELQQGRYGIDILAFLAIVTTVASGEYWAAIVIVLMLEGGEALEEYASGRAQQELTALLAREPQYAHLSLPGGSLKDVAIAEIKIGDMLLVKPGEVVPVDGILQDDAASIDESSITGESLPHDHIRGNELMSGSVNSDRAIRIKATHTAHDSQYQRIVELVKSAATTEAPFVRLADRYAVPFTIIALAIGIGAWAFTGEAIRFVEVLVVATPCPLLLGAPIALISGISRSAKQGIIVKNGATLEKLARIVSVAFDKTGTLTRGLLVVKGVHPENGNSDNEVLMYAASAELQSGHILGLALVSESKKRGLSLVPPKNVSEETAQGVVATVDGKKVVVGKFAFLHGHGISVHESAKMAGETAIYVAYDSTFAGSITFTDEVRENSKETLKKLRMLGVKNILMLTGDSHTTANLIAKELEIQDVHAECLPEDKVRIVKEMQNRPVLMVGDGVNDAPVLAAADVGLALGARGATAASETADAVVLVDDIDKTAEAISLAKNTMKIALQSVWVGILISIGLMIIAAFGIIPPVVGATLQEVVDVVVILNALRAHGSWKVQKAQ